MILLPLAKQIYQFCKNNLSDYRSKEASVYLELYLKLLKYSVVEFNSLKELSSGTQMAIIDASLGLLFNLEVEGEVEHKKELFLNKLKLPSKQAFKQNKELIQHLLVGKPLEESSMGKRQIKRVLQQKLNSSTKVSEEWLVNSITSDIGKEFQLHSDMFSVEVEGSSIVVEIDRNLYRTLPKETRENMASKIHGDLPYDYRNFKVKVDGEKLFTPSKQRAKVVSNKIEFPPKLELLVKEVRKADKQLIPLYLPNFWEDRIFFTYDKADTKEIKSLIEGGDIDGAEMLAQDIIDDRKGFLVKDTDSQQSIIKRIERLK